MGLSVAYLHSLLQLPSLHALSRHEFGEKPSNNSLKEIAITSSSRLRTRKNLFPVIRVLSKGGGWSEDSEVGRLNERRSPLSPNKEEILALFKRIQASISDGEASISKKRNSKSDAVDSISNNKPAADTILDVLRQPRTRAKGKTIGKKRDKVPAASQPDSTKIEKRQDRVSDDEGSDENLSAASVKPSRPVSSFSRKSPIPAAGVSSRRKNNVDLPEDRQESSEREDVGEQQKTDKFEEMKLTQLKEVAKSRGIKGYSKLKKSELVELLLKS